MDWTLPENGPKLRAGCSPRRNNLPCVYRPCARRSFGNCSLLVLWRIILQENRIEIKIRSMELRQQLESRGKITFANVPVKNTGRAKRLDQPDRRGQEKKVWRRSASHRTAELQCLARAS